ncbi:MAG TPA: hypothetical protein VHE34_24970 [Puia sp.]|uniref:hypothetical protein n=1 Tax=Puia sp. TaxID=2045100 RepID=UPI002C69642E|nr:hypothetical protein [Puia sp.]HVU98507.1 hypothetical protein [Puia sp.]
MSTRQDREIVDVDDFQKKFNETDEKLVALRQGFYALAMDFGFHIENTFGDHRIQELRDNVIYRFFSSMFHCQLLMREHHFIGEKLEALLKRDPQQILRDVYPANPHFEYAEKMVSSIVDSIVFHLSSVYDYMSILIHFVSHKDRDKTLMWSQICRSARDPKNTLYIRGVAKAIDTVDRSFAIKLYDHRSELLHRSADITLQAFQLKMDTGKFNIRFICTPQIRKTFKSFGEPDKDYTVSHFSFWLVNRTAETIGELLVALKHDIEQHSEFPHHTYADGSKPFIMLVDPITHRPQSPSKEHWERFHEHFPGSAA